MDFYSSASMFTFVEIIFKSHMSVCSNCLICLGVQNNYRKNNSICSRIDNCIVDQS